MSFDPYAPCPCGSGKKLKFCCQPIADEMEKTLRLRQGNQVEAALKAFDALAEKHRDNPWVVASRARLLISEGRGAEAITSLERLVAAHPEDLPGLVLYATAVVGRSGFKANKPVVHRVFQRCTTALPSAVVGLASLATLEMLMDGKLMAARQHLVFALRVAPEEQRNDLFRRLIALDGDHDRPFPLRSVHLLAPIEAADEIKKEAAKAAQVADRGCYGPAGILFLRCAEKDPENAALWHNVGLCRAWDGDEAGAVEAFHCAARLEKDFDKAVEIETLAQLLQCTSDSVAIPLLGFHCTTDSAAQIISRLDESDRLVRIPKADDDSESVAVYEVLDRPLQIILEATENSPAPSQLLGRVEVFDAEAEEPARVELAAFAPFADEARRIVAEVGGIELVEVEGSFQAIRGMPREWWPLFWDWRFDPQTPRAVQSLLAQQQWKHVIENVWPKQPLAGLEGRTPEEAAHDPAARLPLAAAVIALDACCDIRRHELDTAALRRRLGLSPPAPLTLDEQTSLNRLTALELERAPLGELGDAQLGTVLNRAMLIRHARFVRETLLEVLSRPAAAEMIDREESYGTLYELALGRGDRDEAAHWLKLGKEAVASHAQPFDRVFAWDFREFAFRIENPTDPELSAVTRQLWRRYGRKIPALGGYLRQILRTVGVDLTLDDLEAGETVGSVATGGVWTPEGGAAGTGERGKLWLPGQE